MAVYLINNLSYPILVASWKTTISGLETLTYTRYEKESHSKELPSNIISEYLIYDLGQKFIGKFDVKGYCSYYGDTVTDDENIKITHVTSGNVEKYVVSQLIN